MEVGDRRRGAGCAAGASEGHMNLTSSLDGARAPVGVAIEARAQCVRAVDDDASPSHTPRTGRHDDA